MEHAAEPNLVRAARHGDPAAFASLLRPLLEPAYRLAVGMLQDRQLAEDAVQEAAVNAWRKLYQLREGREMRPWFLGIVAHECATTRRNRWFSVLKIDAEPPGAAAPAAWNQVAAPPLLVPPADDGHRTGCRGAWNWSDGWCDRLLPASIPSDADDGDHVADRANRRGAGR